MLSIIMVAVAALMTIAGDYYIKLASQSEDGIRTGNFILGALLYGLPAFAWFYLMRHHSMAAVAVFYSASTVILLAAMGHFWFEEAFGLREAVGVGLAVASVVVIGWGH